MVDVGTEGDAGPHERQPKELKTKLGLNPLKSDGSCDGLTEGLTS
jgi:hypothetical protein